MLYYNLKWLGDTEKIVSWKSKGLSAKKNLLLLPLPIIVFLHQLNLHGKSNFCLVFKGSCLKQKNTTCTPFNRTNYFVFYELDAWSRNLIFDFTLKGCLFGGVKLATKADPDKSVYSGYDIGFDSRSEFSLTHGSVGKNVIIFWVDMSSFVHIDNKWKDILILGKGLTQELTDTKLTAEAQYSINFSGLNRTS